MALEIERKFLVSDDSWREAATERHTLRQAYISTNPDATLRIRIIDSEKAFLTIKSRNCGETRNEWEYEIPLSDAAEMFDKLPVNAGISKTRYIVGPWEIDEFHGALEGLTVAEIELPTADMVVASPSFIGKEVTDDPRYFNSALGLASAPPEPR